MLRDEINSEMHRHALAASEMVRAEYGHELDFSEATIGAVEAILNGFWKEIDTSRADFSNVALLFGSYIGEIVRCYFPKASWEPSPLDSETGSPIIKLDDIELFPISWCFKRLYNGPADSVVTKYLAFRKVIDERMQAAKG